MGREKLTRVEKSVFAEKGNNLTFWYSHYPTSTITCGTIGGLRTIIGHYGAAYLCGHLHDLGGLGNEMYAIHSNGTRRWCRLF